MDAELANYCLREFHWRPSTILELTREEKAFILACASEQAKAYKKMERDAKSKAPRKRR